MGFGKKCWLVLKSPKALFDSEGYKEEWMEEIDPDVSFSNNSSPPFKEMEKQKEVIQDQEKKLKEMQEKLDKMGENGEEFKKKVDEEVKKKLEREPLTPREIKDLIKEFPKMSDEQKKEIREKLKMENDAYHEVINKELKEQLQKAEKKATKAAQELRNLQENGGSPAQIKAALAKTKEADKNAHQIRLQWKKMEEAKVQSEKKMQELFEATSKPKGFFGDLNFKSPWTWGILTFFVLIVVALWFGIRWLWGKAKSWFSG